MWLIGDRAYDADPLDEALAELGIEMTALSVRPRNPYGPRCLPSDIGLFLSQARKLRNSCRIWPKKTKDLASNRTQ
jgi:hypothetical protein